MFINVFDNQKITKQFSYALLQGVSLYIDEMRLVYNISNEYQIYRARIKTGTWKTYRNDKLFAMIVYKNLFPRDFADLQLHKGFVYSVLSSKGGLVSEVTQGTNEKIASLKASLESAENELFGKESDIDDFYKERLATAKQKASYYGNTSAKEELEKLEATINKYKENIRNRSDKRQNEIKTQIAEHEAAMHKLNAKRISELLSNDTGKELFELNQEKTDSRNFSNDFANVKNNHYFNLLKFLLINGHVDETYYHYITYFYPNSISENDLEFCLSVTDRKPKTFDYHIDDYERVLERLPEAYFQQIEVLNYGLLAHLLEKGVYYNQLHLIVMQIVNNKHYCINPESGEMLSFVMSINLFSSHDYTPFLKGFISQNQQVESLVKYISTDYPTLFHEVSTLCDLPHERILNFALCMLCYNDLTNSYSNGMLAEYISNNVNFINVSVPEGYPEVTQILANMVNIGVSFVTLDSSIVDGKLITGIYNNNLYEIKYDNIKFLLERFYGLEYSNDFKHKNYTLVQRKPNAPLARYIGANLSEYMEEILKHCDGKITDDEASEIAVLNNADVSDDLKQKYIEAITTAITDLNSVTDRDMWTYLMCASRAVVYNVNNVVSYFSHIKESFDDVLTEWINQQKEDLDFAKVINEPIKKSLFDAAISSALNNDRYENLISTLGYTETVFNYKNVPENKMTILSDRDAIQMNEENLCLIRDNYKETIVEYFIVKNIDAYIELLENNEALFSEPEVEYLLRESIGVLPDKQTELLGLTDEPISISSNQYSERIILQILKNNFYKDDIAYFISTYDESSPTLRAQIINNIIPLIDEIWSSKTQISRKLLDDLKLSGKVDDRDMKQLLALALRSIGLPLVSKYFNDNGLSAFNDVFKKEKRPQFDDTELNRLYLFELKRMRVIKEIVERDDGKLGVIR